MTPDPTSSIDASGGALHRIDGFPKTCVSSQRGLYRIDFNDARVSAVFSGRQYPRENYSEFLADAGLSAADLLTVKQEHTSELFIPEDAAGAKAIQVADGIVTGLRGAPIGIRTADCVPLFYYDPSKQVIAVVHGGWKGLWRGIAGKAVRVMSCRFGCQPCDVRVVIGPCIRFCCFEVGEEFKGYFPESYRIPSHQTGDLKAHVDLPAAATADMIHAGVLSQNITDLSICTSCRCDRFFSARRGDGDGRILSVMTLNPI